MGHRGSARRRRLASGDQISPPEVENHGVESYWDAVARVIRVLLVSCGRALGGRKNPRQLPTKGRSMVRLRCSTLAYMCGAGFVFLLQIRVKMCGWGGAFEKMILEVLNKLFLKNKLFSSEKCCCCDRSVAQLRKRGKTELIVDS